MLKQYDAWTRNQIAKRCAVRRFERIFKADVAVGDEDDTGDNGNGNANSDGNGNGQRHLIDELANFLVEAGSPDGPVTRESALQWLLHSREGQALVTRMAAARKRASNRKVSTMKRSEHLAAVVRKAGGLNGLARRMIKGGNTDGIGEAELVGMITEAARAEFPHLTSEAAFTKLYTSPQGEMLRRAVMIAKATQLQIMPVATAAGDTDVANDTQEATRQMEALVDEQIRRAPEMTRGDAWDAVVRDNPSLAERALRQPSAKAYLAFPR
jgi:hypothetical protein